jgi:vitamin B12 transporter
VSLSLVGLGLSIQAGIGSPRQSWGQDASAADAGAPDAVAQSDASGSPGFDTAADAVPSVPDGGNGLVLPVLRGFVDAPYTPAALAARIEGAVVLRLTVGSDGAVTEAEVVERLGYGLDEAAQQAASRFRFSPATRDGRPIAARIRYEYRFELPRAGLEAPKAAAAAPAPAPRAPAPPAAAAPEQEMQVTVRGASTARRLRESAEAVTVVDVERAKRETADVAEVLARVPGLSIRRAGGFGSYVRIAINGLTDNQIRYFIDGVPSDMAGFGLGIAYVPLTFLQRVEVFRGVVPIRFGTDALGGAFNFVTQDDVRGAHANASVEVGSFGRYRLTLAARHTHAPTGFYTAVSAFRDHADNDYLIDVQVADDRGRLSPARVHKPHDVYDAYGGFVDIGFVDRPWARRLILRAFGTRHDKQVPHNLVMSVPYGEVAYWETGRGANLHYEQPRIAGTAFGTDSIVAVSRTAVDFEDLSPFVYDWYGRRLRESPSPGEIGSPTDQRIWEHKLYARLGLSWTPLSWQQARLVVAPTFAERTGRDYQITSGRDPLTAERRYLRIVSGFEYQVDVLDRRLESITFAKSYVFQIRSEQSMPGGIFQRYDQDSHTFGFGEALRFRLRPGLWIKASYERGTRLPDTWEVFGDGRTIDENLALRAEQTHNANLSLTVDRLETRFGHVRGEVNGFLRTPTDLIVFLPNVMRARYENVNDALSTGVEASGGWTAPGRYLEIDGNFTWQDLRNKSTTGTFGAFEGDRLPNRPWLFANLAVRAIKTGVSGPRDEISLGYYLRYQHWFYRSWESVGRLDAKQFIPTQVTQTLALTYVAVGAIRQSWTLEVDNVANARRLDNFGVQLPGRAIFMKVTAEF